MKKSTLLWTLLILLNACCIGRLCADEYDILRAKWKTMLTGGTAYNPADPDISAALTSLDATANGYNSTMDKSPTRTYLWSDLPGTSNSSQITSGYGRLRAMALAYSTYGSSLYGNATLAADIVSALDWMNVNCYNTTRTTPPASGTSNWWDWQIGIPLNLNDATALMYDSLTLSQVTAYMAAVDRYTSAATLTGANRTWQCVIIGVRAVLAKDGAKIAVARDGLSAVLSYKTSGDGYYLDGSYIQHNRVPYNGGYGLDSLKSLGNLMYLLEGSTWTVTDPNKPNLFEFIYDSYQPLIYKGAMMDMVRGREISRNYSQDHAAGHRAIQGILRLTQFAPSADALAYKKMVKYWVTKDTFSSFYVDAPVEMIVLAKAIMGDASIPQASELVKYQQLAGGDRAVFLRPGFGFGLGMFSTRMYNYEAINSENLKAWYTGAGTTYLYNNDLAHYGDDFWPTVNAYRLPGTTVVSQTTTTSQVGTSAWAGGTDLLDTYGVSGMELAYTTGSLTAKKSWFMFDDEIVALGAGITSTDGIIVETVVENRKINGSNAFTVNGTAQPTTLGWSQTLTAVNSMHLAGNVSGSDIGYYFPVASTVKAVREARTGSWRDINNRSVTPTTPITKNYLTLWLEHGSNPVNKPYQYVLLPNFTSSQVSAYATNPEITIVENSTGAQAVRENTLGLLAANFWNDAVKTVDILTVDKKASAMLLEPGTGNIDFSISDPTMTNTGVINVEIARSAASTISSSTGVTVTQLSPTIKFSVNVNGAKGAPFRAKFDTAATTVIVDNVNATATSGWTVSTAQTDRYGPNYLHDGNTGKGTKSVTYTPSLSVTGTYNVYMMWPAHANRATNVPVEIVHAGTTNTVTINQQSNGGVWNLLATYTFNAGTGSTVKIKNDGTNGYVVADAVKFELVP